MPALVKTSFSGKVTWLGFVPDRDASLRSTEAQHLTAGFDGIVGEAHNGAIRKSCARVVTQYPKGTDIRNTRQICIVSSEEMAQVAVEMGVEHFDPRWCGASMVIEGIPDFTHIPPSSRLQTDQGTTLTVDMENQSCNLPARVIEAAAPGHGKAFKAAARNRRGVTAWVEREGFLSVGDIVTLHIPQQRAWEPKGRP